MAVLTFGPAHAGRPALGCERPGEHRGFITHHFALDDFDKAYDVFARAADTGALKVVLSRTA